MRWILGVIAVLPMLLLFSQGMAASAWLAEKQMVRAPNGYRVFCEDALNFCNQRVDGPSFAMLGPTAYADLNKYNQKSNFDITYTPDNQLYGELDLWKVATESGDCEDIALAKRAGLINAGWPANALWLAIGIGPGGESHVVLIVRSNRGDLVLDNRFSELLLWHETNLRFLARQVPGDARYWRRLATSL
jgi:predicted transglutaminase-like cysteine proteinase